MHDKSSCGDTVTIHEPAEILNTLGAYFETVNAPRPTNLGTDLQIEVDNHISTLISEFQQDVSSGKTITTFTDKNPAHCQNQPEESLLFTNVNNLRYIFRNLPNKTSSGLDSIPPIILKHIPMNIIVDYAILFNNCLKNKFFPEMWKRAKIFPILKKNKPPTEASSHRPISLTPAISKVYEIVINATLKKTVSPLNPRVRSLHVNTFVQNHQ